MRKFLRSIVVISLIVGKLNFRYLWFDEFSSRSKLKFVFPLMPFRILIRLTVQKGNFNAITLQPILPSAVYYGKLDRNLFNLKINILFYVTIAIKVPFDWRVRYFPKNLFFFHLRRLVSFAQYQDRTLYFDYCHLYAIQPTFVLTKIHGEWS